MKHRISWTPISNSSADPARKIQDSVRVTDRAFQTIKPNITRIIKPNNTRTTKNSRDSPQAQNSPTSQLTCPTISKAHSSYMTQTSLLRRGLSNSAALSVPAGTTQFVETKSCLRAEAYKRWTQTKKRKWDFWMWKMTLCTRPSLRKVTAWISRITKGKNSSSALNNTKTIWNPVRK